ncbi:hypothetical protein ATOBIA_N08790 [Atopobiaceae bacterium P1]|uniref:Uncharacterized protein n=1 Tax=Leptogranulimonas caecicola TaxID=2894156 RepID=A0AAU9D795_9ACTN|nr:hypothetical protein ATOBIA_N08790 [Atopobiaceae bacterium P1]BDC90919.1 hypothetical protein ATTO_07910 [Leptogranulimonas caecicola]
MVIGLSAIAIKMQHIPPSAALRARDDGLGHATKNTTVISAIPKNATDSSSSIEKLVPGIMAASLAPPKKRPANPEAA